MVTKNFGRLVGAFCVIFIFFIIYEHNLIIKVNYNRQRLAQKRDKLMKEQNELTRILCQLKNQAAVRTWATDNAGMSDLAMSQVITLTTQTRHDFFITSTLNRT
jgi:hypothetical protein